MAEIKWLPAFLEDLEQFDQVIAQTVVSNTVAMLRNDPSQGEPMGQEHLNIPTIRRIKPVYGCWVIYFIDEDGNVLVVAALKCKKETDRGRTAAARVAEMREETIEELGKLEKLLAN